MPQPPRRERKAIRSNNNHFSKATATCVWVGVGTPVRESYPEATSLFVASQNLHVDYLWEMVFGSLGGKTTFSYS